MHTTDGTGWIPVDSEFICHENGDMYIVEICTSPWAKRLRIAKVGKNKSESRISLYRKGGPRKRIALWKDYSCSLENFPRGQYIIDSGKRTLYRFRIE